MKIIKVIFFLMFSILISSQNCFSFNKDSHKIITKKITEKNFFTKDGFNLDIFLINNFGFQLGTRQNLKYEWSLNPFILSQKTVEDYILKGATLEDEGSRPLNHFHDPYRNSGLWNNNSALVWAQINYDDQLYSWQAARIYYYLALTSAAPERNDFFAKTFRTLGQVMHLVEDMAVPEHTRSDAHPIVSGFDGYVEKNIKTSPTIDKALDNPFFFDFSALQHKSSAFIAEGAPVSIANLFDTNTYLGITPDNTLSDTSGLSEYSNANFFSTDTNEVDGFPIFPYPELDISWMKSIDVPDPLLPGQTIPRVYFVKTDGPGETNNGQGYKLSAMDVFYRYELGEFGPTDEVLLPLLDDHVLEDYASLLLPRATGYAATLMSYFFRGQIEITPPEQGVYALSNGDGFDEIRLKAKNITQNDEQMAGGKIELVVRYQIAEEDPFQVDFFSINPALHSIVIEEKNGVTSIPSDDQIELVFDLASANLPLWATDLTFQLVYRGRLGYETSSGFVGEEDAVAVGFRDVSEPTIVFYGNSTDLICLNDKIMASGSDEALAAVDSTGELISSYWDVYPHGIKDNFLKFSPLDNFSYASSTNYDVTSPSDSPNIYPGYYSHFFVIAEPVDTFQALNSKSTVFNIDDRDPFIPGTATFTNYFYGMQNQLVYKDGAWVRYYSILSKFRDLKIWFGTTLAKPNYPIDSTCDLSSSTIPIKGESPVEFFQY